MGATQEDPAEDTETPLVDEVPDVIRLLNEVDNVLDVVVQHVALYDSTAVSVHDFGTFLHNVEQAISEVLGEDPGRTEPEDLQPLQRVCCLKQRLKDELESPRLWAAISDSETLTRLQNELEQLQNFCLDQLEARLPNRSAVVVFDVLAASALIVLEYLAAVLYLLQGDCSTAALTLFIVHMPTLARCAYIAASVTDLSDVQLCVVETVYTILPIRTLRYAVPLVRSMGRSGGGRGGAGNLVKKADDFGSILDETVIAVELDEQLKNVNFIELHLKSPAQFLLQACFILSWVRRLDADSLTWPRMSSLLLQHHGLLLVAGAVAVLNLLLQSWAAFRTARIYRSSVLGRRPRGVLLFLTCLVLEAGRASSFVLILSTRPLHIIVLVTALRIGFVCLIATVNAFKGDFHKRLGFVDILMEAWSLGVAVVLAGALTVKDVLQIICVAGIDVLLQASVYVGSED